MGIQAAPEVKFRLIQEAVSHDNNMLSISMMCQIAGVSRSGYYQWCSAKPARENREEDDRKDFDLILEAYRYRGYAKGARGIHMRLLHMNIIMNVKKIRRLMRKYQLGVPSAGRIPTEGWQRRWQQAMWHRTWSTGNSGKASGKCF